MIPNSRSECASHSRKAREQRSRSFRRNSGHVPVPGLGGTAGPPLPLPLSVMDGLPSTSVPPASTTVTYPFNIARRPDEYEVPVANCDAFARRVLKRGALLQLPDHPGHV